MHDRFRKIAKITLVLVYLVIAAGAIVRMTGSGMGCPDWPKCFGYYIPPTDASELQWKADHDYSKGQVIIADESLWVAQSDFRSTAHYSDDNWMPYTKHDYAIFNPWHTWIEFINRLFGALAGLATLVLAFFSFRYWKTQKSVTILSVLTVFAMGFQAWLGATVVFSVLEPVKITVHMVMALIIVAMLLYIVYQTKENSVPFRHDKSVFLILVIACCATLAQIILGTQVRQFVDVQIDTVGETAKHLWLLRPPISFYIHRSFSIIVVALYLYAAFRIYKYNLGYPKIKWVLLILLFELISGMTMYYLNFPFASQPLHLMLSVLLFGTQFYLVLETLNAKKNLKTL
tara:strand:+ start:388 stop:1422 length:1035 start_codon:yes stop_codon:yes gene_type:complete